MTSEKKRTFDDSELKEEDLPEMKLKYSLSEHDTGELKGTAHLGGGGTGYEGAETNWDIK